MLGHRSFMLGAMLTALLLLTALLSLWWTPGSAYDMDLDAKLAAPGSLHWLGTDAYGRDVASLLFLGARSSILVGVIAVGIGLSMGVVLGLVAAVLLPWLYGSRALFLTVFVLVPSLPYLIVQPVLRYRYLIYAPLLFCATVLAMWVVMRLLHGRSAAS